MLRRIEFTRDETRYRARIIPWPPDDGPAFWYISVDNGVLHKLFAADSDDVGNEAFEGRLIEALGRLQQ